MRTYSIKEISEIFQLPPSTLRYYETEGILPQVPRSASGQRIYSEIHIKRLSTISCFKRTGMTISQLREFFYYEADGPEHIDDILSLLREQEKAVTEELRQLQDAHAHVLRKLRYYGDIKTSLEAGKSLPDWKDYKDQ